MPHRQRSKFRKKDDVSFGLKFQMPQEVLSEAAHTQGTWVRCSRAGGIALRESWGGQLEPWVGVSGWDHVPAFLLWKRSHHEKLSKFPSSLLGLYQGQDLYQSYIIRLYLSHCLMLRELKKKNVVLSLFSKSSPSHWRDGNSHSGQIHAGQTWRIRKFEIRVGNNDRRVRAPSREPILR